MPRSTSVPPKVLASLRAICGELPETYEEAALLYDTLRTTGAPYFQPAWGTRWGTKVIGMRLGLTPPALAAPETRRR